MYNIKLMLFKAPIYSPEYEFVWPNLLSFWQTMWILSFQAFNKSKKKKAKEKVLFLDNLKPKDYEEVGICYWPPSSDSWQFLSRNWKISKASSPVFLMISTTEDTKL